MADVSAAVPAADLHRDGDDVVEHQRDRGDLGEPGPKFSRATTYEPPALV